MARPLRIEFPGALYHVTARGNAQGNIYLQDSDRQVFLSLLHNTNERYNWVCHAYCLMDNHYHLLIETGSNNLSRGMKYLNGVYTQSFNRTHQRIGHVYQGRYKAILVEKEAYLLELCRYIVLNPVRARMVRSPKDWRWSSYRATAGQVKAAPCLMTDWVLSVLGNTRAEAQQRYREFVVEEKNQPSPWEDLKNQIYLGSDGFVEDMQCKLDPDQSLKDIPRKQKQAPPKPLSYYENRFKEKKEAMAEAYLSGHYTLEAVGKWFGCSYATVSRAVKSFEEKK